MLKLKTPNAMRIAWVQHGDHWAALQSLGVGADRKGVESYFGMRYSVEVTEAFCGDNPKLIISLNPQAGEYDQVQGASRYLGYEPAKKFWKIPGSTRWNTLRLAKKIIREIEYFRPTHLVLRTPGLLGIKILEYATQKRLSTLVMFANSFFANTPSEAVQHRKLLELCNNESVYLVGNHRCISTRSMLDYPLKPEKAVAYDWPGARQPKDYDTKDLEAGKPVILVYAATMLAVKGIGDLIQAVGKLRQQGINVQLTAFGVGADLAAMKTLAQNIAPAHISFPGQVNNDVLFEALRKATVVCIPTRPEWQEGGSLILTEALASRTPVVLSNQSLFQKTFVDMEGICFFQAGNGESLAGSIARVVSDPLQYQQLSRSTLAAFERAVCPTTFGDLLERWRASWKTPDVPELKTRKL